MTDKNFPIKKGSLQILFGLWVHISKRRKIQLIIFSVLNLLSSFSESFSILMTLPLISVLINPNQIWEIEWIKNIFLFFGVVNSNSLITPITVIFIGASIFATILKLFILRTNNYFAAVIGNDFSSQAYAITLNQPYEDHLEQNSSEIISAATSYVDSTREAIYSFLNLLSYSCFVISIEITLFVFNWKIAIISILVFSLSYLIISYRSKLIILKNGKVVAELAKERVKSIQEGLGSIRDVLLGSKQYIFTKHYSKIDLIYRRKLASNKFITFSPRYIIENIGFILIAVIAYQLVNDTDMSKNALPLLGTFAVAAQKLLPSMQQCYNSLGTIRSNKSSVIKVLKILNQYKTSINPEEIKPYFFKNKICLSEISFGYINSNKLILEKVNLQIKKGERIGIIGTTGSGKTTLTDIIMGLLRPTKGDILVDNIRLYESNKPEKLLNWRLAISHVPQNIFLSDRSISENIAFGVPLKVIDFEKDKEVAKSAQIHEYISNTSNKYLTKVGENGLKLSGGQRQRIGIARALYNDAQIIIFDQATSSLDNNTEEAVIDALNFLDSNLTIIIVAHRLTTIKKCDRIIKVENSKVEEIN